MTSSSQLGLALVVALTLRAEHAPNTRDTCIFDIHRGEDTWAFTICLFQPRKQTGSNPCANFRVEGDSGGVCAVYPVTQGELSWAHGIEKHFHATADSLDDLSLIQAETLGVLAQDELLGSRVVLMRRAGELWKIDCLDSSIRITGLWAANGKCMWWIAAQGPHGVALRGTVDLVGAKDQARQVIKSAKQCAAYGRG